MPESVDFSVRCSLSLRWLKLPLLTKLRAFLRLDDVEFLHLHVLV